MEEGCLYCQKEIKGRKDKKYCSTTCKKYYHRWMKREIRTPYSFNRTLSEEEILLKEKAEKLIIGLGNSTAELILKAIELDHFKAISNSQKKYIINKKGL